MENLLADNKTNGLDIKKYVLDRATMVIVALITISNLFTVKASNNDQNNSNYIIK